MNETIEGLLEALSKAVELAIQALVALLLALLTLLVRGLSVAFTLTRIALPVAAVALLALGAVRLFPAVYTVYGGDMPAALLALVSVVVIPVSLQLLAPGQNIWGIAIASGAIMLAATLGLQRAPPLVTGLVPATGLAACICYFAFGQPGTPKDAKPEPDPIGERDQ
jgi:hypothetical protein